LAREVDQVKEIVSLVAEPLVVDELSLIKNEPVRVKGRCRNPKAIKGSIEIFFNGVGKLISFEVEGSNQGALKGGKGGTSSPGSGNPDDSSGKDKDKGHKEDNARRSTCKFDRYSKLDKESESGHEESMEEDMEKLEKLDGNNELPANETSPIAAFHPSIGLVQVPTPSENEGG
jgi:hypothetical protein